MPSNKKPSREEALQWAREGKAPASVLAWTPIVADPASVEASKGTLQAARVVLGADGDRARRIALHLTRIEELTAAPAAPRARRARSHG